MNSSHPVQKASINIKISTNQGELHPVIFILLFDIECEILNSKPNFFAQSAQR
jgi:hypothetical protein